MKYNARGTELAGCNYLPDNNNYGATEMAEQQREITNLSQKESGKITNRVRE